MLQFFKYLFITLGLFSILNLFRSNIEVSLPLHFEIPLVGDFLTAPVPIFYLLICSFCLGAVFITLLGALRIEDVFKQKKELKKLKKEYQSLTSKHDSAIQQDLPPLVDE